MPKVIRLKVEFDGADSEKERAEDYTRLIEATGARVSDVTLVTNHGRTAQDAGEELAKQVDEAVNRTREKFPDIDAGDIDEGIAALAAHKGKGE